MNRMPNQQQCMSQPGPAPRYSSLHSNSSAFSANAGPNEDWTKISDLAERRRIQNRIAQRNYRKKLKRRLEDLERRAASSSASPEPAPREAQMYQAQPSETPSRSRAHTLPVPSANQRRPSPTPSFQHSRSMSSYDEESTFQYPTARHQSPVPIFSQPAFSSEEIFAPSYCLSPSYSSSTSRSDMPVYNGYLYPRAGTMPSLASGESVPVKQEHYEEEMQFPPLEYLPAEMPRTGLYRDNNPNIYTPSLSDSLESLESCPSSVMGPPADLWALYPTPPGSVVDDENSLFGLHFTTSEKSDLFTGVGSNFESNFDEEYIMTL